MLRNYLKTAFRNLWKTKTFSLINIIGLALGLSCSMLIALWVRDEYRVDAFHANGSCLYSVYERQNHDGQWNAFHATPSGMADEMKRILPEVQYATNFSWNELATFEANGKIMKRPGNYAGADFFQMFSYPLLEGTAKGALERSSDIAISKKMATDFFGSPASAIGQAIRYQNKADFIVTAVFDNIPSGSTQQFDYLLNWKKFSEYFVGDPATEWTNSGPSCYLQLRRGTDPRLFEKKIERFLDPYNKTQTPTDYIRLGIQPYAERYLHSAFNENGQVSGGRIQYVRLFSIVAVFILFIACINFTNLSTARSMKRAREIGVRKVIGAKRSSLIGQFIGEAMLVAFLAVVVAAGIIVLALPHFNQLTGKATTLPYGTLSFWLSLAGLILLTGFISGIYPAFYLSAFAPVRVLKGKLKMGVSTLLLRKGLVVFQFTLSIMLIIATIVVSRQVQYIQSINLGYSRSNLIYIPLEGELPTSFAVFKTQAVQVPGITGVSRMSNDLSQLVNKTSAVEWEGKDPNSGVEFAWSTVGYDFMQTLQGHLLQGRDFSRAFSTDSSGYMLNETAIRATGYKDPIGKPFTFREKRGRIIGIVRDFHINSLHEAILPLVLSLDEHMQSGRILIRTAPGQTGSAIAGVEKIFKALNPKLPFTYTFSDEAYAKLYQSEQMVGQLSRYFAFLAIVISCLGLLGLVMFAAEQRTKELGIRKVLGASPLRLFHLLSKEFVQLVLIALVIASPLAWLVMHQWLQDYAYKVAISWWMFVAAGISAIGIALLTVCFQAVKAALVNPVKALRSE